MVILTSEQRRKIVAKLQKLREELTRSEEELRAYFNLPRPQARV
jgi:hypothetical protein